MQKVILGFIAILAVGQLHTNQLNAEQLPLYQNVKLSSQSDNYGDDSLVLSGKVSVGDSWYFGGLYSDKEFDRNYPAADVFQEGDVKTYKLLAGKYFEMSDSVTLFSEIGFAKYKIKATTFANNADDVVCISPPCDGILDQSNTSDDYWSLELGGDYALTENLYASYSLMHARLSNRNSNQHKLSLNYFFESGFGLGYQRIEVNGGNNYSDTFSILFAF